MCIWLVVPYTRMVFTMEMKRNFGRKCKDRWGADVWIKQSLHIHVHIGMC